MSHLMYYILMKYYIVGASEFAREKFHPEDDAVVIAADAGVKYVGERADLAIGDWDSLHSFPANIKAVTLPVVKDYTDTGEAVDHALQHGATEIVMFGTSGGRVDHYLANLQYLVMIELKRAWSVPTARYTPWRRASANFTARARRFR